MSSPGGSSQWSVAVDAFCKKLSAPGKWMQHASQFNAMLEAEARKCEELDALIAARRQQLEDIQAVLGGYSLLSPARKRTRRATSPEHKQEQEQEQEQEEEQ